MMGKPIRETTPGTPDTVPALNGMRLGNHTQGVSMGQVIDAVELLDATGTLIGYIAIYDVIGQG